MNRENAIFIVFKTSSVVAGAEFIGAWSYFWGQIIEAVDLYKICTD